MKRVVLRTCIISRKQYEKKELIRIVKTPNGEVFIDHSGKLNGRGAYLKLEELIIQKAIKSNLLKKHLDNEIPQTIYEELLDLCKQKI